MEVVSRHPDLTLGQAHLRPARKLLSAYGGDAGGRHYSASGKIDRSNVGDLELAWSFQHGELEDFDGPRMTASWHVTPILLPEDAGRSLVICTPFNRVIALDPVTGEERWAFDPEVGRVEQALRGA